MNPSEPISTSAHVNARDINKACSPVGTGRRLTHIRNRAVTVNPSEPISTSARKSAAALNTRTAVGTGKRSTGQHYNKRGGTRRPRKRGGANTLKSRNSLGTRASVVTWTRVTQ